MSDSTSDDHPGTQAHSPSQPGSQAIRGLDRVLSIHRPVVLAHIKGLRRRHPAATPQQLIAILERHYLAAVTSGGAAVGATAVIPAVGTGASLALTGVETLGFLEASALFAQSITEVHGIAVGDPDRARALVMTLMMGSGGADLVQNLARQAGGSGLPLTQFWGTLITRNLPQATVGPVADQVKKTFLKHFAVWTGGTAIGRMMPFGIGAVIGGGGNLMLGRRVIVQSRSAFGPAPLQFPAGTEPTVRIAGPTDDINTPTTPAKSPRGRRWLPASPGSLRPFRRHALAEPSPPPEPSATGL
ncbi:hypothetical protein KPL76_13285 [Subtercola sp. PAMC28395]|uniref:hypothetical protein n=1 Tax=Subtercola sp. PAMC28395 TaxID=2846775 RepID=UPI001C0B20B8|nr:hypothetical protein [Subtercola sp. PAMC28395]QWT23657.1 hypothetical protein KPL76_13285 [Subtercola sp. PAMC28395]